MASELVKKSSDLESDEVFLVEPDIQIKTNTTRKALKKHQNKIILSVIIFLILILSILVIYFVTKDHKTIDKCDGYNNDLIVVAFDGLRWDYLTDEYQSKWNINLTNFRKITSTGVHIKKLQPVMPTVTYPNFYTLATGLYPGWSGIPWNTFYDPLLNNMKNKSNDNDKTGVWWPSNPIWTTIQNNQKLNNNRLTSAVAYWRGSRANNNFSGSNNGYANWYLPEYNISDLDARTNIFLNELNRTHYNLGMIYYDEPDEIAHEYGPNSNETAQILQYCDTLLGNLLDKLDVILPEYDIIVVSDHGFTECVVPSPLVLDMNMTDVYLDKLFQNKSLKFDVTAPQLPIKIDYSKFPNMKQDAVMEYVTELLRKSIIDASLYENELFWIYKKGEIPYELNQGKFGYRLPDILVEVKIGYEWNIINSNMGYNRNVTCAGGHSWNNTLSDMQTTLLAKGPHFKQNYVKNQSENVHLYELMCKLMCKTEPQPNNGSFEQIKDILLGF